MLILENLLFIVHVVQVVKLVERWNSAQEILDLNPDEFYFPAENATINAWKCPKNTKICRN